MQSMKDARSRKSEVFENNLRKLEKLGCHLGYLILK